MESTTHDPMIYGWLLTVVGMGGTVISLWLLAVVMVVLKRLFPCPPSSAEASEEKT